ncbi:MAG: DNA polymerase III subunit gamma/tau [Comamonadaceae bacterium]|nr:DNA polymerase III subunit gamma/tau [Burkholderiales bacterium]MEB2349434.1 DNA polymerase III subunit gamma/tau [Comamonadaceae bacterium]
MSYLVLARKYRPRNFPEMVGQEHVVRALTNALTQQRLHHAYLFTGTRGIGKTTVSRILAKSLNCTGADGQGGITATPCGVCPGCVAIDAGRFPDYVELDAASNRGVDEVQGLLEQAVYKPVQGRFKVFMIDEVHMLTNTAFNAMLKTLEEPPEYLKFVLATTDPQKVPVTVLSRCLQFNLRPMAPETIHEHLAHVLAAEQIPFELQALRLIARAARGSMRDALSLTDQAIAFGSGALQEAAVRQMLGSADRAQVLTLIDALARGDGRAVVQTSDELRAQGLSAASTLQEMVAVLQRMAVLQAVADLPATDADDPDAPEIARLAQAMPGDEVQLLYSICLHGTEELGLAPDEYAALTMVLLRLLAFKPAAPGEKKKLTPPEPAPGQAAASVAAAPAADRAPAPSAAPAQPAAPLRLPVRSVENIQQNTAPAPSGQARAATETVEIPVRSLPAPDEHGTAALDPESTALRPAEEGGFWHGVVHGLIERQQVSALTRELALQSQLVARDGGHWHLRVESASLNQPTARERLCAALREAGHASEISVEVGPVGDSPARRDAAAAAERQRTAEAIVRNDPQVQQLMRDFGAKIVPGSVKLASM